MAPDRVPLDLDVTWIHGSRSRRRRTDPPLQVHTVAPGTVVIRQSKDLTYEAPFLLLLVGEGRALLLDTGATRDRLIRDAVHGLIGDQELVVAHTHGHGDHTAGDASFADRPVTTVVGTDVAEVRSFFGFTDWPDEIVSLDLGGRVVEVFGIPGHHATSIALYDARTGLLHTGDTVYPGRIYVDDPPALMASFDRLVHFAESRDVAHVLGCHVEMTRTPGRDYPLGARHQPDEPSPFMTPAQLRRVRDQYRNVVARPGIHRFDDVVFCNGSGPRVMLPLLSRSIPEQVRYLLR
ncbi:MAG TPA: MBL fold metallo-hydrolase [Marmoricola sp.]|nr:MBL fold metallo-hydrolase [Marmoricola sp.]